MGDARLNQPHILFQLEYSHNANPLIIGANLDNGKLSRDAHQHSYKKEGPIWLYWWHIDKDWVHKKNTLHKSDLGADYVDSPRDGNHFPGDAFPLGANSPGQWGWTMIYKMIQKWSGDKMLLTMFQGKFASIEVPEFTDIEVIAEDGQAKSIVTMDGRRCRLVYVYIETEKSWKGDNPRWILLIGEEVETGKRVVKVFDVAKGKAVPNTSKA